MSEVYAQDQTTVSSPIQEPHQPHSGGRPSKYDPKYCEELIAYFNIEPSHESEVTVRYKNGDERTEYKQVANDLPTLAGFATKIGVHRETLNNWSNENPEFFDALKRAKEMQERILVSNGLQGLYQQPFAIFTAKNILNWRDKQEVTNELVGELQKDGTRRPFELFVNLGGGFVPTNIPLSTAPAGSTPTESPAIQGIGVAPESTKDVHSDNGTS